MHVQLYNDNSDDTPPEMVDSSASENEGVNKAKLAAATTLYPISNRHVEPSMKDVPCGATERLGETAVHARSVTETMAADSAPHGTADAAQVDVMITADGGLCGANVKMARSARGKVILEALDLLEAADSNLDTDSDNDAPSLTVDSDDELTPSEPDSEDSTSSGDSDDDTDDEPPQIMHNSERLHADEILTRSLEERDGSHGQPQGAGEKVGAADGMNQTTAASSCWSFSEMPFEAFLKVGYDEADDGVSNGMLDNIKKDVWESLPHLIILDSGASTSMLPLKWCAHVRTIETDASRRGEQYTAANGGKIYNRGDKVVTMMSRGGHLRNMKFNSCDVERALGSVSSICKQGHTAVFNAPDHPDGSYTLNRHSGERMGLQHKDGVYVLDTKIAPSSKQACLFGGQGR